MGAADAADTDLHLGTAGHLPWHVRALPVGQATVADCRRGGQRGGRTAERLAVADTHALPGTDAAPPLTEPVGYGIPAPDGHAAADRDAATDRRADGRVPDGHPGAHPVGEHFGGWLTDRPISAAGRLPRAAWAA